MIEVSYEIIDLFVFPEKNGLTNVIGRVNLQTTFSRNGASIQGRIDCILDTDNLSEETFIPVNNITTEIVSNWAIAANGGEAFLEQLKQFNDELLTQKEKEIGLVRYEMSP